MKFTPRSFDDVWGASGQLNGLDTTAAAKMHTTTKATRNILYSHGEVVALLVSGESGVLREQNEGTGRRQSRVL